MMTTDKERIDSKFDSRYRNLLSMETLSEIKEESINKELSLGKSFQEKLFLQKRIQLPKPNINTTSSNSTNSFIEKNLSISPELYHKCKEVKFTLEQLNDIINHFNSDNLNSKYIGFVGIRKLLLREENPPINIIFENELLHGIIEGLNMSVEFQYEALWCLINISFGKNKESEKIIKEGGYEKILNLLNHNLDEIKEMALWCIDNFVHESLKTKKLLANKSLFNKLITLLATTSNEKIISHCVSIIRILIKHFPNKKFEKIDIKKLINLISKLIIFIDYNSANESEKNILYDCCFILSYISENIKQYKDILLENGVIQHIIKLIKTPNIEKDEYLFYILLNIIGNIINGNVNQTNQILNYGIIDILKKNITTKNKKLQKEICWIISNISADIPKNKKLLIDIGLFPILCDIYNKSERSIRIEVIYALCNLTQVNDKYYLDYIINNGILNIICSGIKSNEMKEIVVCLEALIYLLHYGKKTSKDGTNFIGNEIEKMGMLDVLENLQYNKSEIIYEYTYEIIKKFFPYE